MTTWLRDCSAVAVGAFAALTVYYLVQDALTLLPAALRLFR